MSFTGYGPLGSFGWGTTTSQALAEQAKLICTKYDTVVGFISKKNTDSTTYVTPQPFPSLTGLLLESNPKLLKLTSNSDTDIFPAAVFTDNEAENWPIAKREALRIRKREFSDQPQDVKDATNDYRAAALSSLQRRHAVIEALPASQRTVLYHLATWISALVVNVRLREILLYPLIRDQLVGGIEFYTSSMHQNDDLRLLLRTIRNEIYQNERSTGWYSSLTHAQQEWQKNWEKESKFWEENLTNYLRQVPVSHTTLETNLPTNHDLNYGQQLKQMFEIGYSHMIKTGNMQGFPRPRQDPEWICTDGFEQTHPLLYGIPADEKGTFPKKTDLGYLLPKQQADPQTSSEIPPRETPSTTLPYLPFGASLTRIIQVPDAASKEQRNQLDALFKQQAAESRDAHNRAAVKHYGSEQGVQLAKEKVLIASAADKAIALQEFLTESDHTTDLDGSYYYNEVTLAFRNHGTHWESLSEDLTPIGEHYLLIHYDVMYYAHRLEKYRLTIHGCVEFPLTLTLPQVKEISKDHTWTMPMVMECSGNGRAMMKPRYNKHVPWGLQAFGCYSWTGVPLRLILQRVGVMSDCVDVVFTGYDSGMEHGELRYFQHALEIHDPVIDYSMLCWQHNGVDLLANHGYPLRLMVPAWYGNVNIKWLQSIELVNRKFKGVYQRTYSYSKTPSDNDLACSSKELRPHAILQPMGYPDFTTRRRTTLTGKNTWVGKAWVGGGYYRAVVLVEVSLDGGTTWIPCKLEPRLGIFGWHKFQIDLDMQVGLYAVMTRATDCLGNQQCIGVDWNWASMQDDAIQKIDLVVVDGLTYTE